LDWGPGPERRGGTRLDVGGGVGGGGGAQPEAGQRNGAAMFPAAARGRLPYTTQRSSGALPPVAPASLVRRNGAGAARQLAFAPGAPAQGIPCRRARRRRRLPADSDGRMPRLGRPLSLPPSAGGPRRRRRRSPRAAPSCGRRKGPCQDGLDGSASDGAEGACRRRARGPAEGCRGGAGLGLLRVAEGHEVLGQGLRIVIRDEDGRALQPVDGGAVPLRGAWPPIGHQEARPADVGVPDRHARDEHEPGVRASARTERARRGGWRVGDRLSAPPADAGEYTGSAA
jgi:hypothetical protein